MRQIKHFLLGTLLLPTSAVAADYGTYRPGNTYLSMPAQNPDQCISYCASDAQCRGWNFVRVNPVQTICEFNARDVAPVASAISISGMSATSQIGLNSQSSNPLLQTSGTVTRVGQILLPQQPPFAGRANSRQVVHESAPTLDPRHQIASYRSRLHSIETPKTQPASPQHAQQTHIQQQAPIFIPQPSSHTSRQARSVIIPREQPVKSTAFQPMLDSSQIPPRPAPSPQTHAETAHEIVPQKVQIENLAAIPRLSEMPTNNPRPSINAALAGGPVAGNLPPSSSLYGSLFDDVKRPRSLSPDDIPQDLNAPIPTVTSVPVEKIEVSTF